MRIPIEPGTAYHLINHGPCPLITTGDGTRQNVAPICWTAPANDDPPLIMMAMAEGIYSEKLIQASGEFAVNVMGEAFAAQVAQCGKVHGDTCDKFQKFGLTPLASKKIRPPFLKESLAHIECVKIGEHAYDGVKIIVGKVLHAEVEQELWDVPLGTVPSNNDKGRDGKALVVEKARTIHHVTGGVFAVTERVIQISK